MNSFLWRLLGWGVGLLDYGFLFLRLLGSQSPKFFRLGYGDVTIYEKRFQQTLAALDNGSYSFQLTDKIIDWGSETLERHVTIQEAHFRSPLAEHLPQESAYCQFYMVKPIGFDKRRNDDQKQESPTYIIMLPATGEMDIRIRMIIARQLARTYGLCSVIVTAPYYGSRKPEDQSLFLINSVKDILLQSQAVIEEAVAICQYLRNVDRRSESLAPTPKICFTGFSYGAAMAACASSFALKAGVDGNSLSCAAYVGSSSPNVLADGILESGVQWDALRQDANENQEDTRKRLFDLFDLTQLNTVKPPKIVAPLRAVKAYAMTNDLFIRPRYSQTLERQVQECLNPNFKMQWLPGGHVSAALMRPLMHKKLIVDTITAME